MQQLYLPALSLPDLPGAAGLRRFPRAVRIGFAVEFGEPFGVGAGFGAGEVDGDGTDLAIRVVYRAGLSLLTEKLGAVDAADERLTVGGDVFRAAPERVFSGLVVQSQQAEALLKNLTRAVVLA